MNALHLPHAKIRPDFTMKKLLFPCVLAAIFLTSCSNDFEVAAPWKDIPIVYGLLDIGDTAHYVRVERAFLDPNADAFQIAQIPDSIYYSNAIVQLEKVNTGEFFTLQKVDGNLEGYPRQPGPFATSPNWLYKIDSLSLDLREGDSIVIHIDRGNGLPVVTAGTSILGKGRLRIPIPDKPSLSFDYNLPTTITWSASPNARIFDVILLIHYAEYPLNDPNQVVQKTVEWKWGQGIRFPFVQSDYSIKKQGLEFFQVMANNIPEDPNMKRIFDHIEIRIIQGGFALERYVNVALANTGITASQDIPIYTNLSEGRGVFSSVSHLVIDNVNLNSTTRDSLRFGQYTKKLNF